MLEIGRRKPGCAWHLARSTQPRAETCRGPNGLVVSACGALRPRRSAAFLRGPEGGGQGFGAARDLGSRGISADAHGRNRPV